MLLQVCNLNYSFILTTTSAVSEHFNRFLLWWISDPINDLWSQFPDKEFWRKQSCSFKSNVIMQEIKLIRDQPPRQGGSSRATIKHDEFM